MVETLDSWIRAVGPLGYLALFAASLIEYVFPPFPGDTVVLLGGVFAVRGQRSWALVLAAVTIGSVLGAAIDYIIGSRLARRFERRGDFAERHPHVVRLQMKMRAGGIPLIAFNRFMPGVRGLIFLAAGASGMDFRRVMVWGALSALLWNALILAVGIAVGGNAERLARFVHDYNRVAWGAIALGVAGFAAWYLWRFRRRSEVPRGSAE
jgi:membrane protein DedA with SNARE-associated domain